MAETLDVWLALRWLSGFILLWCVASIPGYWVLNVWMLLRAAYLKIIQSFAAFAASSRSGRLAIAAASRAELQVGLGSYEVDDAAAAAWTDSIDAMSEKLEACKSDLAKARKSAVDSVSELEASTRRVKRLNLVSERVPDIPSSDVFLRNTTDRRKAVVNCVLAVGLLIPIAWANAQLTGLVLRDYLPPLQPVFGMPLPFVIAVILVALEAAIGLLHSMAADRDNTERKISIGELVTSAAALIIMLAEARLYAAIDPAATLQLSVGGSVFGFVGFLLGFGVFGLGRVAHASAMTVRKAGTPKHLAKSLERLREAADEWNASAETVAPTHAKAVASFEQLGQTAKLAVTALSETGQDYLASLETHKATLPDWARASNRTITEAEFREKESRAYFWLTLGVLALACLAAVCSYLSRRFGVGPSLAFGVGLGLASFAFGAFGAQSAPRNRLPRLYTILGLFLATVLLTVSVEKLLMGSISLNVVGILVPAAGLFISGLQLGPIALLRLPLTRVLNALITGVLYLALGVCWLLNAALALVEYALRILAWPTHAVVSFFSSRRREPALV